MNITTYIFKKTGLASRNYHLKVYSYPTTLDKNTQKAVADINIPEEGTSVLRIVRNDKIVNYIYAINVFNNIFGFIFIVNDVYLAEVDFLVRFCNDMIATISANHQLLRWRSTGELEFTQPKFDDCREEAEEVLLRLAEIRNVSVFDKSISLPPLDYSSENTPVYVDCRKDEEVPPIEAKNRQLTFVELLLPKVNYPVAEVVRSAFNSCVTLNGQYYELKQEYAKLNNQKKRIKWVIFLLCCLIMGGILLFGINKHLNETQLNLTCANDTIGQLTAKIDSILVINQSYYDDIYALKMGYERALSEISKYPIIVTGMEVFYSRIGSQGDYAVGVPNSGEAQSLFLKVNYTNNTFEGLDLYKFPSVENLEAPADTVTPLSVLEIRCRYRKGMQYGYKIKEYQFTEAIYGRTGSSNSFNTPNFNMDFDTMPAGHYIIELWNRKEMWFLGYTEFTIY